ncbi:MAG: transposase, partial [Selenomonadaceae bacterium]
MNLSTLYQHCHHVNRNQASPAQMLAILTYAYARSIFSTRKIEEACRSNIKFMYLLEGKPAPDHATISRFITERLRPCIKEIFAQMGELLERLGVVSFKDIFIDGTKIESVANKYKF